MIDPGHDLNKNTLHSLELTRRLAEVADLGYPTLAAVSNKDFIGETLDADRDQRRDGLARRDGELHSERRPDCAHARCRGGRCGRAV